MKRLVESNLTMEAHFAPTQFVPTHATPTHCAAVLDIGSSFIKAAIVDLPTFQILQLERAPFPHPISGLPTGYFEIELGPVVAAVEQVLDRLLQSGHRCESLHTCTQMGGVVLAGGNGKPLTNYVSWRDQRTTTASILSKLTPQICVELGNEIRPGTALTLLNWMLDHGQLPAQGVPQSLGDFILSHLTGAPVATEPTSAMGLIQLETNQWHRHAFQRIGLDKLNWPVLVDVGQPVGNLKQFPHVLCYPAVGDHQAALLGTLLCPRELSINISTGSQVSVLTPEPRVGNYQTRAFFDGQYLNTITHIPAGRSLTGLVNLLSELAVAQGIQLSEPWDYIDREAARSADSDLEVELTFFDGTFGNQGQFRNITLENLCIGSLFRACFRKMSDYYQTCANRLSQNGGPSQSGQQSESGGPSQSGPEVDLAWDRIVLSGGLSKLSTLRQFIQGRFPGFVMRTCDVSDETLVGLAILAASGTGKSAVGSVVEALRRNG